jgi:hypothetical protein
MDLANHLFSGCRRWYPESFRYWLSGRYILRQEIDFKMKFDSILMGRRLQALGVWVTPLRIPDGSADASEKCHLWMETILRHNTHLFNRYSHHLLLILHSYSISK